MLAGEVAQTGACGDTVRIGQRDQQPLPDRLSHGGAEQSLAGLGMGGERGGHSRGTAAHDDNVEVVLVVVH